ncbi:Phytocyanin domain, partial [Dillenia turbinata]
MASPLMKPTTSILLLFTTLFYLQCFHISAYEFEVGGSKGWLVPPSNGSIFYNDWASHNRFSVGDTIRFRYRKDSVMEVSESEYKKCNSTQPLFFSNTGNTVFQLDHSGPFYFISGVSGHCERGQKMIIKVLTSEEFSSGRSSASKNAALSYGLLKLVLMSFV